MQDVVAGLQQPCRYEILPVPLETCLFFDAKSPPADQTHLNEYVVKVSGG